MAVVDLVNTVPAPLTSALVQLAPLIAVVTNLLQIVSWQRSWYDGWLAVAVWWAICLLSDIVLRYLLPFALVALLCLPSWRRPPLTTEQSLQNTVNNLLMVQALLPLKPAVSPSWTLLRIGAMVYIPYLLLFHFIRLRVLLAITGTAVLTARAPFIHVILDTLQRSAWIRWSLRHLVSFVTGHPLPPIILSYQPTSTSLTPVPSLRFLFTIYENQRWWMGLDWTAALLPGERPSWCTPSPAYLPVSPPNAFSLPSPTTVFLPNGKGTRVKRTATWRWEELEWKVVVHREGSTPSRVERPIPEDNLANTGTASSRLLKAAGKMRESGIMGSGNGQSHITDGENNVINDAQEEESEEDKITTDQDGWIYGDNKWEGTSSKGGMGKYTRYRRWTRIATLGETVETVEDGPIGIECPEAVVPLESEFDVRGQDVHAMGTLTSSSFEENSPLRQRLRRALSKPSNPP